MGPRAAHAGRGLVCPLLSGLRSCRCRASQIPNEDPTPALAGCRTRSGDGARARRHGDVCRGLGPRATHAGRGLVCPLLVSGLRSCRASLDFPMPSHLHTTTSRHPLAPPARAARSRRPLAPPVRAARSRRPLAPSAHAAASLHRHRALMDSPDFPIPSHMHTITSRHPLAPSRRATLARRPLAPPARAVHSRCLLALPRSRRPLAPSTRAARSRCPLAPPARAVRSRRRQPSPAPGP